MFDQPDHVLTSRLISRRDFIGAAAIGATLSAKVGSALGPKHQPVARTSSPSIDALAELFRNPPREFAPVDNWWWEAGRVDKAKISWQLKELKDKGVGGTWFYVRWVHGESLSSIPPYWSDAWWDLTRFSVEEHQRLGLIHYFSNWTLTQFQQNLVRKERQANRALGGRRLVVFRLDGAGAVELEAEDEVLDAAAYRMRDDAVDYSSRALLPESVRDKNRLTWKPPGPGWCAVVVVARPWDLDYTNAATGRRFSEAFLGEYERRLPTHPGKTLRAFGADEMILLNGEIPFSQGVLDQIRTARDYDPTPYLIGLFGDIGPKTDQIRCDYYDALTDLLEKNFFNAPTEWLNERGMKHATLSQLGEGDPLEQTAQLGDIFRYLRTFDVPGNEDPGRMKAGDRRLIASKLSSSIAHLYERDRAVMCVHYASGWGMTQEENLAWTNESFAKGLNLYCRHGAFHTLMGGWYEWVPPMDHFYQPHWMYWGAFTSYVTRLSAVLSLGKHRADVALVYPISTIHAHWAGGRNAPEWLLGRETGAADSRNPFDPAAVRASQSLKELAEAIYHEGIDFDFLDNASLERAKVAGPILEVAGVEFRSIVLPAVTTLRLASAEKLREYYEGGGTIVAFERLPTASAENGRGDPKLKAVMQTIFGPIAADGTARDVEQTSAGGGKGFFVIGDVNRVPRTITRAIVRDVQAPETDLFHIHKRFGELDVYFLFNVKPQTRDLSVRFRAQGNVEIWNPHTGERRPVYRVTHGSQTTEVRLSMNPAEGILLVFWPGDPVPALSDDNVSDVTRIEVAGDLTLLGFDELGGTKKAKLLLDGDVYAGMAQIEAPPARIALTGPFSFRLEPTMDNRWGDFRYPPSNTLIGAEARRFRYFEDDGDEGLDRGWHQPEFDESAWDDVTYSYGPYWWHLGPPFQANSEPQALLEQARRGEIDVQQEWNGGSGKPARWRRQFFSKKFGYYPKGEVKPREGALGGLLGVPENFLVVEERNPEPDTHYFFTTVHAPAAGEYFLHIGTRPDRLFFSLPFPAPPLRVPQRARAWVNGTEHPLDLHEKNPDSFAKVQLRTGSNTVLIEILRPERAPLAIYAALFQSEPPADDPYIPLLRWFREPQSLVYDITPAKTRRIGWYRFNAPPGTRALLFQFKGIAAQAWIEGQPVQLENGQIRLARPRPGVSQIALRIEQEPGTYGGAVFPEPVSFECAAGQILPGDWSQFGLASYSGAGVYGKEFRLTKQHLKCRIIVDLGVARSVAELIVNGKRAGVRMARPFRFDITDFAVEGLNSIEIKVANTLANHMSTYPTQWVLEGQTVSGLIGPVEIAFHAPVRLIAKKATP